MSNQPILNKSNLNIATINNKGQSLDSLSNIAINNSFLISQSAQRTNTISDNANAAIFLKDRNSTNTGVFYPINVNSAEYGSPALYFNSNVVIDESNLLSELEQLLDQHSLETSNIIVKGGYINFWNGSNPNTNMGPTGVGLRYSDTNTVQFKNYNTGWIDLVDITTHDQFSELEDVNVINPLLNNQYITYNSSSMKYTNSNLAIINDLMPTLGGNLAIRNNSLVFETNPTNLIYDNGSGNRNTLIQLQNNSISTGNVNYLVISNSDLGNDTSITCQGTSAHIGIDINTKGEGDINLNASMGNVYTNSDSLVIGGFVKNSIYRSSNKPSGYSPSTTWNIPITNDIILFDFVNSDSSGTYWANVGAGIDGQKLNIIFNNRGSSVISVLANFTTSGLLVDTGPIDGLSFITSGQSTSLVYLGGGIDAWQVLNTSSGVF
jgi:hypothetical protein